MGVVGVIGPWNYPLYTPMGSIGYALARRQHRRLQAKPNSTPASASNWLGCGTSPRPAALSSQTITGDGTTGALCSSGVTDASPVRRPPRKRVMAACADTLTPLVAECGGKDAMLVDSDADLDDAVAFAAFGAVGNAGQTCAGVERIYVVAPVYDAFLSKLTAALRDARAGSPATAP